MAKIAGSTNNVAIVATAKSAGVKKIDYLVITHYHADHVGGVAQLAEIRRFFEASPEHLRTLGNLPRRVDAYERVYYMVAARDHWCWTEAGGAAMVTFRHVT